MATPPSLLKCSSFFCIFANMAEQGRLSMSTSGWKDRANILSPDWKAGPIVCLLRRMFIICFSQLQESPLSGDKSNDSRPSPERDGGEETETAPEAEDEVNLFSSYYSTSKSYIFLLDAMFKKLNWDNDPAWLFISLCHSSFTCHQVSK